MKIIKPGVIPPPRPTLYDARFTCQHCGAVLQLEQGDNVVTERALDGLTYFQCAFCFHPMTVRWNGSLMTWQVTP